MIWYPSIQTQVSFCGFYDVKINTGRLPCEFSFEHCSMSLYNHHEFVHWTIRARLPRDTYSFHCKEVWKCIMEWRTQNERSKIHVKGVELFNWSTSRRERNSPLFLSPVLRFFSAHPSGAPNVSATSHGEYVQYLQTFFSVLDRLL
jgi:hypothetical protein